MRWPWVALAAVLAAHTIGLVLRGRVELRGAPAVDGLFRTWRPPVEQGPYGMPVIDPRPDTLAAELRARYGLESTPAPTSTGVGDLTARVLWPAGDRHASGLAAHGLTGSGQGPSGDRTPSGQGPSGDRTPSGLAAYGDAPVLLVGEYAGDLVVFVPGTGVTLARRDAFAPDVPAAVLGVPRERGW